MQRCEFPADTKSRRRETNVGVRLEITLHSREYDPCPQIPEKSMDLVRMVQMTREIKRAVPKGQPFASVETLAILRRAMRNRAENRNH